MSKSTLSAPSLKSVSANVIVTAELLGKQFGAMLDTEQLSKLLGIKSTSVQQKISRGDFEIPVTRVGNKWFATAFNVAEFVERSAQKPNIGGLL